MNTIKKILILEDEKLNSERIKRLILKIRPETEILDVLPSVKKTVSWLSENKCPDLILMDVQLADGLCFEIFNLAEVTCPVIFTTAYDEYAIKAFKYNSIDYLLKPIEKEELETAIIKFENSSKKPAGQQPQIEELLAYIQPKEYRKRFLIPYRDGYRKINTEDVAYFYSNMNINYAKLFNNEEVVVSQTLETLEQELDPKNFFRANRQYIIHVNSIENLHNFFNGKLKLKIKHNKEEDIIVSRTKAPAFKLWLDY
ncbi:LytTR family DNA-binding domain-containing protein [Flavobacterium sp. AC]|uniref:LytTR family DNA-binding domain-containing protein n=1 Tax=Flavobacterium azizsancarii TaxID=2961580 RepID=A0ABT4WCQ2_9FLAO|nr:LytTR family DNA-binding domain-containing protein [Flavobacterium azizsancarii]MDA6070319.1 LytTR family DNA-binding domain-containing protein [Flavobacterium azizsancarii]